MAAAAEYSGCRRRFAVACDVLSRHVRAEAEAAARKTAAPAQPHSPAVPAATMLLMPGADITPDVREEAEAAPAQAQLSIGYGGRVLVFGDVLPDKAAELIGAAARVDVPVARKESLRRFMEKRRDRLAAWAQYSAPRQASSPSMSGKGKVKDAEAGCWLRLGSPGGCGR